MIALGRYAPEVLSAWGIGLALLALVVVQSVVRARRVRAQLERVERDG